MSEDEIRVDTEEIERLIVGLPSVLACHVAVNDWGGIEEVHIIANSARAPKLVVRDVESALLAKWRLRIDHKRISVAQVSEASETAETLPRLVIAAFQMDLDTVHGVATATVHLEPSGEEEVRYRGEWKGRYVPSQYYQAMAMAAVEAVNLVPGVEPFALIDVKTEAFAGRPVVMVAVSRLNPRRREEVLVGAVVDRGDGQEAAVRAVLDAVNRKISLPKPDTLAGAPWLDPDRGD